MFGQYFIQDDCADRDGYYSVGADYLCEIDYDGVEYLEDGDTGEIFNSKKQKIGKWDENGDVIIWENDTFRIAHEEQCD